MKKRYLAFATAAILLAGCSNEEDFIPQENLKDTPITVTAAVAELATRAGHSASNLPETFYLTIDQEGTAYDYTNVSMNKAANDNYTPNDVKLLWEGSTATVNATAATFSLEGTSHILNVNTIQSTDDGINGSDHLYMANEEVTPTEDGKLPVAFSHIMSKIILTITLGNEFDSQQNPISNVTFNGTVAQRNYTPDSEPKWSDITGVTASDITPYTGDYTPIGTTVNSVATTNATAKYEVILVPQTITAGKFAVQFTLNGNLYKWTSTSAVTLASGTEYTLALTAGKDKVGIASLTSAAWGTGTGGSLKTE